MGSKRIDSPRTYTYASLYRYTNLFVIFALVAFLVTVLHKVIIEDPNYNLYVHQAQAFLEGKLAISGREVAHLPDVANHNGKYYNLFPPFPAVLLMPFIMIFGTVNTTLISLSLTIANVFTLRSILRRLHIDPISVRWLTLALFLGTGYWLAVQWSSSVWFFAHIVAVTFVLLSMREALGRGRGFLSGLFLGCAVLSRQLTIYSAIFMVAALLVNANSDSRRAKLVNVSGFLLAVGLAVTVYLLFNVARFDDPFDTGYDCFYFGGWLQERCEQFGLFSIAYVPFNLSYMFFQGPHLEFPGHSLLPHMMDGHGTAITFASPFVFFAFFAQGDRRLIYSAWAAISLTLAHMLLYFNNGWVMFNTQRFTLDFFPLLILLVALSVHSVDKRLLCLAIAYSVLLNAVSFSLITLTN